MYLIGSTVLVVNRKACASLIARVQDWLISGDLCFTATQMMNQIRLQAAASAKAAS